MRKINSDYLAFMVVVGTAKEISEAVNTVHAFFANDANGGYNIITDRDLQRMEVWCSKAVIHPLENALGVGGGG